MTATTATANSAPCDVWLPVVDAASHAAADALAAAIEVHGLCKVTGVTAVAEFIEIVATLAPLSVHPDGDGRPSTALAWDPAHGPRRAGIGFSDLAMPPHTDGSTLRQVPTHVGLWCEVPAPEGGTSILIDGYAVHRHLAPEARAALSEPRSADFGGWSSPSAVFTRPSSRLEVRYRPDKVSYSEAAVVALPSLVALIAANVRSCALRASEGWILDNRRWLHGRTAIVGARLAHRVIAGAD